MIIHFTFDQSISCLIYSVFAWEAFDKGTDVHLQAEPTKLEMLHQEFSVKKDDFKQNQKDSILQKVGHSGRAIHKNSPNSHLLFAQYILANSYLPLNLRRKKRPPWTKKLKIYKSQILDRKYRATYLCSSIVSYQTILSCSRPYKYPKIAQYWWYTTNVPLLSNTGTFQFLILGFEVYFFHFFSMVCWMHCSKLGPKYLL